MKRKYDIRNKRNFMIILVLGLFIVGIFSLFVYRYLHTSKILYDVSVGSVLQDTNKNFVNIEDAATLRTRWNGTYYLNYQDDKISLGKRVVIFNKVSGKLNLYGKFYQIDEDMKITELNGENVIENTSDAKFYKLADREYLLVDKNIISEDKGITASNYLLVELDRMGNAKLSNDTLNLKTISPTKLITSKYVFDIANETLKYNKLTVDLKKIIGSTNEYKEEEKKDTKETEDNGNIINNNINNNINTWVNNPENPPEVVVPDTSEVINNKDSEGEVTSITEIRNKVKTTSIIRWKQSFTQVDIDYTVYDPYNEYNSLYVEVVENLNIVNMPTDNTHITINGLLPDKEYNLNFIYTTIDEETKEVVKHTFDALTIKTDKPKYKGMVTGYSGYTHLLSYKIDLQSSYKVDNVNATLLVHYSTADSDDEIKSIPLSINVTGLVDAYNGTIDLTDYDIYDVVKLDLAKIIVNSVTNAYTTIKY